MSIEVKDLVKRFDGFTALEDVSLKIRDGELVACNMGGELVAWNVATKEKRVLAGEFEGKRFNAPNDLVIDAAGRAVTLAVINRDRDRDHAATIDLHDATANGGVEIAEVNGPEVQATNSFEAPRRVDVRERRVDLGGRRFPYTFPAHSVTVLRFAVTRGA